VALSTGALITVLMVLAINSHSPSGLSEYFAENSFTMADGRNVVNVILVDFRALDTLGESVVLAVAGIGVYMLLKKKPRKDRD
jgi:multicomponent Na+:H+ antiporter subunit A